MLAGDIGVAVRVTKILNAPFRAVGRLLTGIGRAVTGREKR